MEPKEKKAFEPSGLVPRSIVRTFERFRQQLLPGSETAAIREYRISRYQVLVSARCLFTLLTIPIATNWLVSSWLLTPLIEHFWNTQQNEIFLNSYQEERAFAELEFFSEKLFFESLIEKDALYPFSSSLSSCNAIKGCTNVAATTKLTNHASPHVFDPYSKYHKEVFGNSGEGSLETRTNSFTPSTLPVALSKPKPCSAYPFGVYRREQGFGFDNATARACSALLTPLGYAEGNAGAASPLISKANDEKVQSLGLSSLVLQTEGLAELEKAQVKIRERVQEKILELAIYYNQQTIISITNIAGDLVSVCTLACLFIWMKPEITILKSFLIEAIYSLSDTTKSFLLILLTDLLVGFHSPRGWETALELLLKHFGLPENQDFVFLFVATFPVLLDTVFKYWIFRHLNKISPSTVATYHSMIE